MSKIKDAMLDEQMVAHKELLESAPDCTKCEDVGYVEKTEWVGSDDCYTVEVRCICNED